MYHLDVHTGHHDVIVQQYQSIPNQPFFGIWKRFPSSSQKFAFAFGARIALLCYDL